MFAENEIIFNNPWQVWA